MTRRARAARRTTAAACSERLILVYGNSSNGSGTEGGFLVSAVVDE